MPQVDLRPSSLSILCGRRCDCDHGRWAESRWGESFCHWVYWPQRGGGEHMFLKMIRWLKLWPCYLVQEVRSKELEQLQTARHRQSRFKPNVLSTHKIGEVCMPSGKGGAGVIGFSPCMLYLSCKNFTPEHWWNYEIRLKRTPGTRVVPTGLEKVK